MSIWTGTVDFGGIERAIIIDSVTERPLAVPAFSDEDDAMRFLLFCEEMDVGDVRSLGADSLHKLWVAWHAAREELRVREQEEAGA